MKKNSLREWVSLQIAKNPRGMILLVILLMNIVFIVTAAVVISRLAPESLQYRGFWASVYYTITIVLDAGCIQNVVADVGTASVGVILVCLSVVILGMITFTGAVIGYVTTYISDFIASANTGGRRLRLSGHIVILNWNSRASEIINDLMYAEEKNTVVVLVSENKEDVEKEIEDRLLDSLDKERRALRKQTEGMNMLRAWRFYRKNMPANRVTVVVREGDTFSTKKLNDIAIKQAKSVIILGKDFQTTACKYDYQEQIEKLGKGNTHTIKTLIQVADLTGSEDSWDDQKIVVEVEDNWTLHLVNRIISHKETKGKCNIIPVPVNQILGQILSQFSVMPELNGVYNELFSNKGAAFYSQRIKDPVEDGWFVPKYMDYHKNAIPLTCMETKEGAELYFMASCQDDLEDTCDDAVRAEPMKLHKDYWLEKRNVIILGHNSKNASIMEGFKSFRSEWNFRDEARIARYGTEEILNIAVVDDARSLDRLNRYQGIPYINHVVEADIFDRETICDAINRFVDANEGDTSVLILSDDLVRPEEHDANALTYLIYVQDIISERKRKDPDFDPESIDVVVEIINPKNYDIVRSYSIDNIVISNRYISKMITQIGDKEAIYSFYHDILTYDEGSGDDYDSKELYIKKVGDYFEQIPETCTVAELIRGVYNGTDEHNRAVVLGYVRKGGKLTIFSGDQTQQKVSLVPTDKLIIFSNH